MSFDTKILEKFPTDAGVYLMKNEAGKVLYVGKAKNLRVRVKQYFSKHRDSRAMIPMLISQVASIDTIVVSSEKEALLVENTLIKKHQPKYNACLKDDKTYFSLAINHKHQWPMVRIARYKGAPPKGELYFGPYTQGFAAKETLVLIRELFPLRQCSDQELNRRTRPCVLYEMKRCLYAPCVHKENKKEYDALVHSTIDFLSGKDTTLLDLLKKEMEEAASRLEFERAGALLHTIENMEATLEKQEVQKTSPVNCDAIGMARIGDTVALTQLIFRDGKLQGANDHIFAHTIEEDDDLLSSFLLQQYLDSSLLPKLVLLPFEVEEQTMLEEVLGFPLASPLKGEKKKLLELAHKNAEARLKREGEKGDPHEKVLIALEEELHLTQYPETIECYDQSSHAGKECVSVRVVFERGVPNKDKYRKYKLEATDDYGGLREVLHRRFSKAKEQDDLPDLVMIDGGFGHLTTALDTLSKLDISTVDVIAIAKEDHKHTRGVTQEQIFTTHQREPLLLRPHSPLLFFLQRIRDEAHRFAITYHRHKRGKTVLSSALEEIPGIGPIKRKRLLQTFGSLKNILNASEEELLRVKGITKKDISRIRERGV